MREFTMAGVICQLSEEAIPVTGNPIGAEAQAGTAVAALVAAPDGAQLEIGLTTWDDGSADLRMFGRLGGPITYDRLASGVRMGVRLGGEERWCELRILEYGDPTAKPTMVKADWAEFDAMLGADTREWLTALPTVRVGTRQELFDETNKRRFELALACEGDDPLPLFAAYVLTRVLPVLKGFGKTGMIPAGKA